MVHSALRRVIDDNEHRYESVSQFVEIKGITQAKVVKYTTVV